jgi:deoxyadenosine/deoxycytidine kinase
MEAQKITDDSVAVETVGCCRTSDSDMTVQKQSAGGMNCCQESVDWMINSNSSRLRMSVSDGSIPVYTTEWRPYDSKTWKGKLIQISDSVRMTKENVMNLAGEVIVLEGGIGQGKTTLAMSIATELEKYGIKVKYFAEPTDLEALEEFMKYQKLPDVSMTGEGFDKMFERNRAQAAIRMQFSMMRRRHTQMVEAIKWAENGNVSVMDRGFFGDIVFMTNSFRTFGVPPCVETAYNAELINLYSNMHYPKGKPIIVRVCAPVEVAYKRYLDRERSKSGNKYDISYMRNIEELHDAASLAWGAHLRYDNTYVPLVKNDATNTFVRNENISMRPKSSVIESLIVELSLFAATKTIV